MCVGAYGLVKGRILSSIDLFRGLIPRTLGPFNVSILLNGCICLHACVSLSRLLVGFRTHLKSMHFYFISSHAYIPCNFPLPFRVLRDTCIIVFKC